MGKILDQRGVALIFVMTAITLLTIILADFSFETQINKLRSYNSQDQLQARLNAEAGLQFALVRLELYQNARNFLERSEQKAGAVRVQDINQIWNIPFIYPIPQGKDIKIQARLAIEKFMENSLLEGEVATQIQNLSQRINLNLLRMAKPKLKEKERKEEEREKEEENDDRYSPSSEEVILKLEERLVDLFRQKFDKRMEEDEEFARKYSNLSPEMLIKEIKFYVSDATKEFEPEIDEIRALYAADDIQPKHAPFESLSELYLLRGWDDELVDMIKNEVTVHGVVAIDLNEITDQGLKLLIPEITEEQVQDFFDYRDDPTTPNLFNNLESFKYYITKTAKILTSDDMESRIDKFLDAGIEFGVYGSLFRVTSTGRYRRSEYTLDAFIEMPVRPTAPPPEKEEKAPHQDEPLFPGSREGGPSTGDDNSEQRTQQPSSGKGEKDKAPPPTQFLRPRVVEITIY